MSQQTQPVGNECPYCKAAMAVTQMTCSRCQVAVSAAFPMSRLADLPVEHQRFIEMFVLAGGNLKENDVAQVTFYDGKPLSLEPPNTVELKVIDTEPGVKGATAAAQYKPATLETGLKITVPAFVGIGEVVQVDTRTGEYLSRVK